MFSLIRNQVSTGIDQEFTHSSLPTSTLPEHFESTVTRYPDHIALEFEEHRLTYSELNARSNALAHYLRSKFRTEPEQIVAICLQKSEKAIIAILGVLKSGAAYLPIDPAYPDERKRYMLEDSGAKLLLTENALTIPVFNGDTIFIDDEEWQHESRTNPLVVNKPGHAAYIIYTSGSTGKPKGVLVEHKAIVNTLLQHQRSIHLAPSDRCSQFTSFAFDVSVLEIFMTFFSGACLLPVPQDIIPHPDRYSVFLCEKGITVAILIPSYLRNMNKSGVSNLRVLITGGEPAIPRSELSLRDEQEYYNDYGPTECAVVAAIYKVTNNDRGNIPIGKPIGNMQAFILDSNGKPLPDGVQGEICIGGPGLARGYLNNPALTLEKFVPSPVEEGKLLYRTGDAGRLLPDGNLEFHGRLDEQVKVRGFRIELGEIENVLQQTEGVLQAAVIAKGEDKMLVAYYVPDPLQTALKEADLYQKRIESWRQSMNTPVRSNEDEAGGQEPRETAFEGWNDSFSRKQIPAHQMQQWLDDIGSLILSLQPARVLEIGCGSGLIYNQIADHIQQYTGADISVESLARMRARIARGERTYPETILKTCAAHEVELEQDQEVDLIILNSVVQYFPGEAYLSTVLENCTSLLREKGGHIVIGDVRDLRLLPAFKCRLRLEKLEGPIPIEDLNWQVDQDILKETELCIDPDWFYQFQANHPAISGVTITWKQGDFLNELSQYRYTVVLQIGMNTAARQPRWMHWDQVAGKKAVFDWLEKGENIIALRDAPNPRLWQEKPMEDAITARKVKNTEELAAYMAGGGSATDAKNEAAEVEQLLAAARAAGYHYRMFVAANSFTTHLLLEKASSGERILPGTGLVYLPEDTGQQGKNVNTRTINIPLFIDTCALLQQDIRTHLQRLLPEYMVPANFIPLPFIPLTSNGKADRKFLKDQKDQWLGNLLQYQAPATAQEQMLASIWQELLGVERIGIHDDFFDLGGHSLKAGKLINRIYKQTGIKLPFHAIFGTPVLKDMATLMATRQASVLPEFVHIPDSEYYPLSPSQRGIWLATHLKGQETLYNIPLSLMIKGPVRLDILKEAFDILISQHESLRTSFAEMGGKYYQVVKPHAEADIHVVHIEQDKQQHEKMIAVLYSHIRTPFDLLEGPLFRLSLMFLQEDKALLLITMHHLIVDGWSMQLLLDHLIEYYQLLLEGKTVQPVQQFQYRDYGHWLGKMIESQEGERQKDYWLGKLKAARVFSLASHVSRHSMPDPGAKKEDATYSFRYPPEVNRGIKQMAEQTGCTVFMILQALLKVLLFRLTGQRDIIIGSAVTGRGKEETEKIAGMLINALALYDQVDGRSTFAEFLQEVRTTVLEGMENQLIPLSWIIEWTHPDKNALFDVVISVNDQRFYSDNPIFRTEDPVISMLKPKHYEPKSNIIFTFDTTEEGVTLNTVYGTSSYSKDYIRLISRHFGNLATQVIANPDKAIDNYLLYDGQEQEFFDYLGISDTVFESAYELTTTQQDIYNACISDPAGQSLLAYFEIRGNIDASLWKTAIEKVAGQEDTLRSCLILKDTTIFQGVRRKADINFTFLDIRKELAEDKDIHALVKKYCNDSRDINDACFKHYLLRTGEDRYITATNTHPVFMDRISFRLLIEKIDRSYHFLTTEKPHSYKKHVFDHLSKFDKTSVEDFWKQRLANVQPLSYAGTLTRQDNIISEGLTLTGNETDQIIQYCSRYALKPAQFFKTIYALLVKYYCNTDEDFCIREKVAGRRREEQEALGCFAHILPVLVQHEFFKKAGSFADLCREFEETIPNEFSHISLSLQNRIIGEEKLSFFYTYQHFYKPGTQLQEPPVAVRPPGQTSAVCDNRADHRSCHWQELGRSLAGIPESPIVAHITTGVAGQVYPLVNNQLELRIAERSDAFELQLDYNERFFNGQGFLSRVRHIVGQIVGEQAVGEQELQFLTREELLQLDQFGHNTGVKAEKNILELFEEQVTRSPGNIAVVFRDKKITYADLDRRSDSVAAYLQQLGIAGNDVVGIAVERSEWMVIALLGVLKAGAAYLPIDPGYPRDRINYMLRDSKVSLLLTEALHQGQFGSIAIAVESIPEDRGPKEKRRIDPNQLAYIIYTSGTTGNPKGVMVEHHSLSNIAKAWRDSYRLDSFELSLLQLASFAFDVFTGDVVRVLTNGGRLIICPSEIRLDIPMLYALIHEHQVSFLESTPGLILPLMDYIWEREKDISFLKLLVLGSDTCPATHFSKLLERFGTATRIINSYGVTEACIDTGFYESALPGTIDLFSLSGNTPIGRPLQNYRYYVCNTVGQPVPVGVPGELLIGGEGLARGYAGMEGLTAEKFIVHPGNRERVYKTGDIVRWLPDGNLEFAGRKDDQVKLRGYRIELQEIESTILAHQMIERALVTIYDPESGTGAMDEMGQEAILWYVSKTGGAIAGLREYMKQRLPDFMVPAHYILLDRIPLTPNGKVDKKALPDPLPYIDNPASAGEIPATKIEEVLLSIWRDILKRKNIGTGKNFFELGGHSLKAVNVIARVFSTLRINLPLNIFFYYPTIREQAAYIDQQQQGVIEKIKPAPVQAFYPLSSSQKRLYLLHQVHDSNYNLPGAHWVKGEMDIKKLEKCFIVLITRHESLRTVFEMRDGEPVQIIRDSVPFSIGYTEAPPGATADLIHSFIQPFDLSAPPLLRVHIYYYKDGRKLLLLDMHHIIADGISTSLLIGELTRLYNGENLEPLQLQYKDFTVWQNSLLASEATLAQEKYWLEQFSDEVPLFNLQTDFPRSLLRSFSGRKKYLPLSNNAYHSLDLLCNQLGCTINHLLLAAFYTLLYKYSGNEDIVIGIPVSGRTRTELEQVMGMFVNTLALRSYPSGKKTFRGFLSEVRQMSIEALKNQDYPFEMLVEKLDVKRDRGRNPLFDIMFSFIHAEESYLRIGNARLEHIRDIYDSSKFDLLLHAIKTGSDIELILEYSTDLFTDSTASGLLGHYGNILEDIILNLDKTLADIKILDPAEEKQILGSLHNATVAYPTNKCLHHLFEEQVAKFPASAALAYEGQETTYRELNFQAERVAAAIRSALPTAGNPIISVLLDREPAMIRALLGILKAGGAYLPIDPDYPHERIRYMLEDSGSELLITYSNTELPFDYSGKRIDIDLLYAASDGLPAHTSITVQPDDLAYIIYTSGSTGNPKGVMISHMNVVRLLFNDRNLFDFTENDVWTLFHSYCFDFSVWEMYGALLFGGKLVIIPKITAQSPAAFLQLLNDQKVTVLNQTPGSFYNIIAEELDRGASGVDQEASGMALRYVIFGGEALKPGKLKPWQERHPQCRLINMYGITETTVHVTYKEITQKEIELNRSNIGKPIPTLSLIVLDRDGNLVPPGVAGELHVAGAGLARGYLNRPALTAEKFIVASWQWAASIAGMHGHVRLYRTGDLARMLPGGDFEYLGRIDHQVKIRGFRIELGEIESKLLLHPRVSDALVIEREGEPGSKYLCAYIATGNHSPSEEEKRLLITDLRKHLSIFLPDYMIPSFFIVMEHFPLTVNGKVDRRRLPVPEETDLSMRAYEPPVTDTEKALAALWVQLLKIRKAGLNDKFFESGGDSLKAAQLAALVHKQFNAGLSIRDIFTTPCLRDMAALIDQAAYSMHHPIERSPVLPYYPASFAAKRLYILNQIDNQGIAYNIPGAFAIEGDIDLNRFRGAIHAVIGRHEILRSAFTIRNREVVQVVQEVADFQPEIYHCEEDSLPVLIKDFIRPFDLSKAPLLRAALARTSQGRYFFFFDIHHIIADELTVDNFIKEFSAVYSGTPLPEPNIQYQDFATWQTRWLGTAEALSQQAFWRSQFTGELPLINMPLDFARPPVKSYEGDQFSFIISRQTADAVKKLASSGGATPFMVMLAAYNILLSKYSGQEDIIIGTPLASRPHADLQDLIGMFVNTLPLRNFPDGEKKFTDFLLEVRDGSLKAFENQHYPFEELLDQLELRRDLGRNPVFDHMFTYRTDSKQQIRVGNLLLRSVPIPYHIAKMDMTLSVMENGDGALSVVIEYATRLFSSRTIERVSGHFRQILEQIAADPQQKLKDMEWITATEKTEILQRLSRGSADDRAIVSTMPGKGPIDDPSQHPSQQEEPKHIYDLFEEVAARYPHHIAVETDKTILTYTELQDRVNRLASLLAEKGCGPEKIVGLYTDRSVDLIVGMFAILKSGAAYLPLDPDYPRDRIKYMLEDSAAVLLLTQTKLAAGLSFEGNQLFLDELPAASTHAGNVQPIPASDAHTGNALRIPAPIITARAPRSPNDLAYVIYTSGSTGKPKGVQIEHRSLYNFLRGNALIYGGISPEDICLGLASISFDASVLEIFTPLTAGARLVLLPREYVYDVHALAGVLVSRKVTFCFIPPSLLQPLYSVLKNSGPLSLNKLEVGAEPVKDAVLKDYSLLIRDLQIVNSYGPTEATIVSARYVYSPQRPSEKPGSPEISGEAPVPTNVPIGRPVHNTHLYIVNEHVQIQPVGVPGELCIAGRGLARGYLNNPALTREKFIPDPFEPGERMYMTGDLAKWLPDGNIEFIGRKDHQVKIRGLRIELGEIESKLMTHPDIRQVLVTDKTDHNGNKFLCAYIVSKKELSPFELRGHLARELPEYMIPSFFITLDKFPLTTSEKVDRKSLPEPVTDKDQRKAAGRVLPANTTEEKILDIWRAVLGFDNISVTDNFFEIGGNSLKIINMLRLLQESAGDTLKVSDLFDKPTIREQAAAISKASPPAASHPKKAKRVEF